MSFFLYILLHPSAGSGPAFKILGPVIDIDLCVYFYIDQIMSKVRAKIIAILHIFGFYDAIQYTNHFGLLLL